jgi:dienelactone hydrolase
MNHPAIISGLVSVFLALPASAQTAAPAQPASPQTSQAPEAKAAPALRDPADGRFWNYFDRENSKNTPLKWSLEPKELGLFTNPENQLLVPDGFKPGETKIPAVVLTPTCGGTKPSTRDRMKEFLAAGYAVLTVESYKPRNTPSCRPNVVTPPAVFKDTYDALAALQAVSWIDKDRIFQVGYSMGGFTAAWVSSPSNAANTQSKLRFRASVGHYGSCAFHGSAQWTLMPFLRRDVDRPVLMLMSDNDVETPADLCFPMLDELKAAGKPVSWHLYQGITHAWDHPESSGHSFTNGWGKLVTYKYDRATTQDASKRTLEFLAQFK